MSLAGLDELDLSWTLRNTLTINNNATIEGNLNTTGAIYDGGIPITITGNNNVWTGNNLFSNFQPTFLAPVADEDMTTFDYMDTEFTTPALGTSFLPLNNTWTGANSFQECPTLTNQATPATNEAVNLNTLNAYLATQTGQLGTVNTWTGTNTFTGAVNVPTPLTLAQFGNKTYVDTEIAAFNAAGGNVEYQEILAQTGVTSITLDPATYTGMFVCMVGAGGNGAPLGSTAQPLDVKTFGGAGGMVAFKIPAFSGTATLDVDGVLPGETLFSLNGVAIASASIGGTGAYNGGSPLSGSGGVGTYYNGITGGQSVTGGTDAPQFNPGQNPLELRTFNVACLNGYGLGGSFQWLTATVPYPPTGYYCLLIKFKK